MDTSNISDWCKKQSALIKELLQHVELLWEKRSDTYIDPKNLLQQHKSFFGKTQAQFAVHQDFDANSFREELQNVVTSTATVSIWSALPDDPIDWYATELAMYQKLSLFLCFHFLGTPRLSLSTEIGVLGMQLGGGYPGGAFYFKLAGDNFRSERMKRERLQRRTQEFGGSFNNDLTITDGMLVVAYTPTLLLDSFIPYSEPSTGDEKKIEEQKPSLWEFYNDVEQLSSYYARFQMRRYIQGGHPMFYLVSRRSACEAFWKYAKSRCKINKIDDHLNDNDLRILKQGIVEIRAKSSNSLFSFYDSQRGAFKGNQNILVAGNNWMRGRGLTSCVLASEEGVSSNRPNRPRARKALSYWTGRKLLATDRQKVWDVYSDIVPAFQQRQFTADDPADGIYDIWDDVTTNGNKWFDLELACPSAKYVTDNLRL